MHRKWWERTVQSLTFLFLSASAAISACALDEARSGSTTARIAALVACIESQAEEIKALQADTHNQLHNHESAYSVLDHSHDGIKPVTDRVTALETQMGGLNAVPAIGDHENTKAIVAYFSDKGQKTCPKGWSPFEEAKDRFIVGAGGKYPVVGRTGGEETVTLIEAEMPEHRHGIPYIAWDMPTKFKDGGTGRNTPYLDVQPAQAADNAKVAYTNPPLGVRPAGGNQPHNNMPPYIALYFCKKD